MIKNILFIGFILIACCVETTGQQRNRLNQFFLNLPKENPGFTGIDDFLQANITYAQPWNGFSGNASNFSVSIYGPLNFSDDVQQLKRGARISDTDLIDKLEALPRVRRRHGLGLVIEGNQMGSLKETDVKLLYAYHLPLNKKFSMSFGTSIGIYQQQVNLADLTVRETNDVTFNQFVGSSGQQSSFIGDFGISIYSDKLYFSLTGKSLLNTQLSGEDFLQNFSRVNGADVFVGYKTALSLSLDIHLNTQISYTDVYDINILASTRFIFKDRIYLGVGLDHDYKWSALFGTAINRKFYMHYAYDSHFGVLKDFASGTHSLSLGFSLFNTYSDDLRSW